MSGFQRGLRATRVLIALIAALIISLFIRQVPLSSVHTARTAPPGSYFVDHFIDGNTIAVDMDGHTESIRLIGVETPETIKPKSSIQCFGPEAGDFVKRAIGARPVRLVADPISNNRDRYNRLVRYAYLENGTLLNEQLIEHGFGFANLEYPFVRHEEFLQTQNSAKYANVGLWAKCQVELKNGKLQTNDL